MTEDDHRAEIGRLTRERDAAHELALRYRAALGILWDALSTYADPDFYAAILIVPDRPAGGFADDHSDPYEEAGVPSPHERPMPGRLAREALDLAAKRYGELTLPPSEGPE